MTDNQQIEPSLSPDCPVPAAVDREFLVACLCAEWCGTCRDYRDGFLTLAAQFPQADFRWFDVEDDADTVGDFDVENFPTLLIQRRDWVLFFGPMLPDHGQLKRLLQTYVEQSPEEAARYAVSQPERAAWQQTHNLRAQLAGSPHHG